VAEAYAKVRSSPPGDATWQAFIRTRNRLFERHPQSPVAGIDGFAGLDYHPYSPEARVSGVIETPGEPLERAIDLGADGVFTTRRIGVVAFEYLGRSATLDLLWIAGYGGGVFLPFADGSPASYPGGRYLYDGIKGADLGVGEREIVLDFNYAYNPSCAYSPRWTCPLAPPENRLAFSVEAGERWSGP